MKTTYNSGKLITKLPDGLKLETSLAITRIVSTVYLGNQRVFHLADNLNTPNVERLKEHHKIALKEYLNKLT